MLDFFLTLLMHSAIIAAVIATLGKLKLIKVNGLWLGISFCLFMGYFAALLFGGQLIPINSLWPDLNWNWSGKTASILFWLAAFAALMLIKKDAKAADLGFTWQQNPGSVKPALLVLLGFVGFQVLMSYLLGDGPNRSLETLLYQGLVPGLDEEPMFRGILLYTFSLAVVSNRISFLGASVNIAGIVLVVLFGLVHGILYMGGELVFSAISLFFTAFYGLILLWLREKTGSLVLPIIAHNCVNVAGQLI